MNQDNLYKKRHSLSHILAAAVLSFYPDAKLAIGPAIDNGFYYDFELSTPISDKDLGKIEQKMRELLKKWSTFEKAEISDVEAKKLFASNPYKLELVEGIIKEAGKVTTYTSGDFTDLCAGPHVDKVKDIESGSFKLDRIAGAYWRGDEKNKMLTRIYGLAFETKAELEAYLIQQEEARKRDHRKIGKELKLFTISDLVGAGLPLMQPNGMIIREAIEDYLWELHKNNGYSRVWTPHITKKNLYETSGHAAKFGDELFRVKGGDEEFFMKPMNCPHHMQIFCDNQFSYRDMPVRYFEPATVIDMKKLDN
jgi:threonyl-tRNA synthetase